MIKGKLNVTRVSSNNPSMDGMMHITLLDDNYLKAAQIIVSPEQLMLALTGRAGVEVDFEIGGNVDMLGKKEERVNLQVEIPANMAYWNRTDISEWIKNHLAREIETDGWILDASLDNRDSIVRFSSSHVIANVNKVRYV